MNQDASALLDRMPAANIEAERGVLGSIILMPDVCDDVALVVRAEDFYDVAHQRLFAHMLGMHGDGRRIDSTLLVNRLKKAGDLGAIGGVAYVAELIQAVPTAAHAVYYAQIVRDAAVKRDLLHVGTEVVRDAYNDSLESQAALGAAEEKIMAIRDRRAVATSRAVDVSELLVPALTELDERMKGEAPGLATEFRALDSLVAIRGGELVILAGRPGMGKTSLAENIAVNIAKRDEPVLFVSLEMSGLEVADRLLSSWAGVDGSRMRSGNLSPQDRSKIIEAASAIAELPLTVDDSASLNVAEIAAVARRTKRRKGSLALIVVDYLQLVEPENTRDNREQQVARTAKKLKELARELDTPVLCLAQLNRQTEAAAGNRPRLSHLRESGAIEQDADAVLFVHRDEYFLTESQVTDDKRGQAEIIVAKNRHGKTGSAHLLWLENITTFKNKDLF